MVGMSTYPSLHTKPRNFKCHLNKHSINLVLQRKARMLHPADVNADVKEVIASGIGIKLVSFKMWTDCAEL